MAISTYDILVYPDGSPCDKILVVITFVPNGTHGLAADERIIGRQIVFTDDDGKWSIPGPVPGPPGSCYRVSIADTENLYFVPSIDDGEHWVGSLVVEL